MESSLMQDQSTLAGLKMMEVFGVIQDNMLER